MPDLETIAEPQIISTSSLGYGPPSVLRRRTGTSVAAMGMTLFLASFVGAWFTNALIIDFAGMIIFFLGLSVRGGRSKADSWALGFMAYYYFMCGAMAASIMIPGMPSVRLGGRVIRPEEELWALGVVAGVGIWTSANVLLLIGLLRQEWAAAAPTPDVAEPDSHTSRRASRWVWLLMGTAVGVALLFLLIAAGVGLKLIPTNRSDLEVSIASANGQTHRYLVECGYTNGNLAFVVFTGERSGRFGNRVDAVSNREAALRKPDGSSVRLPASNQLFEVIDGEFRESPERVTREEFEAFMASSPAEYTIDDLLRFAKSRRQNRP